MARALLLHNPAARNPPDPRLLTLIAEELRRAGFAVDRRGSSRRGDLEIWAGRAGAEGFDRVVICGGDGSVREVAQGLCGTPVSLGLVPLGTANALAREMGMPLQSPLACAAIAARGRPVPVALGSANGKVFTFCASAGLDSMAVARVDLLEKKQTGAWAYAHSALMTLLEAGAPHLRVERSDGRSLEAAQVFAVRARHYGGPFFISRSASLHANSMTILAVAPPLVLRLAAILPRLLHEGIEGAQGVTAFEADALAVTSQGPCPVQADGDAVAETPCVFRMHDPGLNMVFPA